MEESKGGSLQEGASSVKKITGNETLRPEDKASGRPKSSSESVGNGMTIKQ